MHNMKSLLVSISNRIGLSIAAYTSFILGFLLLIATFKAAAGTFLILLVAYGLLWAACGRDFFKNPPL